MFGCGESALVSKLNEATDEESQFVLTENQISTLSAVCDTVVPSIHRDDDEFGVWGRSAIDLGADQAVLEAIEDMDPESRAGMAELLDMLELQGFPRLSQASREQTLTTMSLASRDAAVGIGALKGLTLFFAYGLPPNPAWPQLGFSGPASAPPDIEKPIVPLTPADGDVLEADAVIVGSGAGGGVIAGRLAEAGLKVIVLEAGGYFNEADFDQTEVGGYSRFYWRGGPTPTADMNISLQAGAMLGGGTVINWTNCLDPKPWVREEWATDYGLSNLTSPEFEAHVQSIRQRLGVNDQCSELNPGQQSWRDGAERLGWSWETVERNWDPDLHDPVMAGYMGWGDQSGAKQSTLKTYLQDAVDNGADVIVNCFAERVLVEEGRAVGVSARIGDAGITVRAPQVVIAAGALESPALLLRSGIGGPATGDYLRLHPCTSVFADYGTDQKSWWGPPHAGIVDEFSPGVDDDGYGFLIEGAQYTTGLAASAIPFTTAAEHKAALADFKNSTSTIGLIRDFGHGRVVIDENGQAQPLYSLSEPRDVATSRRALESQIRLHEASGARRIYVLAEGLPVWRVGDDVDAFVARSARIPLRAGGARLFSAHQMGTCRMGEDPETSVADPRGELHYTPGVWIGDGSAFPTSSGTNPMITIMSLASRTAEQIIDAAGIDRAQANPETEAIS
ncbi:MAG: GMC family oxidoreductase [Thermoleophilia bacterium]|nr:GMC family oxidoreductase [Thermoleophilia bacterium]